MKRIWRVKKLDGLLIRSFIPPFILATFIALFVLIMQTLWLYIDDILGKGASVLIVAEFLFYLSMSLVPLALPVGVLLASVMLFGNLGERYELSSMKSAGISLFRIMMPLIILCGGIAFTSFLFNEYVIPYSNLKFKSRLYDLRKSSPTLNLEEGVFNDDFNGYIIHIGEKSEDGRGIKEVLIYDHQNTSTKGETNIIKAKEGEMFASEDNNFFVMKLHDGFMYQEMSRRGKDKGEYPFIRSSFKEWTKVFDLRQFEMNRTDEDLFKSNQSMKNSAQLRFDIDSMQLRLQDLREISFSGLSDLQQVKVLKSPKTNDKKKVEEAGDSKLDSTSQLKTQEGREVITPADEAKNLLNHKPSEVKRASSTKALTGLRRVPDNLYYQDTFDIDTIEWFYQTFPVRKHVGLLNALENDLKVFRQRHNSNEAAYVSITKKMIKHVYELNIKYSFAIVCIIFLFIGAPMGAIVRKGGFGYPLLISIFFFIFFILMTIFCKKLAESRTLDATLAAWVPVICLIPVGVVLTVKAMNDSKFIDLDALLQIIRRVFKRNKKDTAD